MPFVALKKYAVKAVFICILFLSFTSFAYEGNLVVQKMSLDSVLREVVMSNPRIQEALKNYSSIKEEVEAAKSGYRPKVGTSLSVGREVTDGVGSGENYRNQKAGTASLYAKQKLFDGGGTESYVDETKSRMMAAAYQALDTANKVFEDTVESYLKVLKERELLKIAEKNVYVQAQILEQIQEKTNSGFGRKSDLLNAQSRLALARANFISQQQNLKQASVSLHKHLGRFLDPRQLVEPKTDFVFPKDVGDVVEMAFKNYPALEVTKYNILTRKYGMKRTEAQYYPTVDAEVRADYSDNTGGDVGDTKSFSAMLHMNYEFYDGGKRNAETKKDYASILKEHERSYIERRNLNESVRLAWNIKEAEEKKHQFLVEHVKLSLETMNAFKEEYQLGRRTLLELLDMENELQNAKKALVESRFSTMLAYFRVMHVTGMLLYEYETSLFDKVHLSKKKLHLNMLADYGNLNSNKDEDNVVDSKDECDNSIFNSSTNKFGCANDENVSIGYLKPEKIEPYIKPNKDENTGELKLDGDTLKTQDSLGEPEPGLPEPPAVKPETKPAPEKTENTEKTAPASEKPKDRSFSLHNIMFELNSGRLTRKSERLVDKIATDIKKVKGDYTLEIIGYTDNSGREAFNLKLSDERAQAVRSRMVKDGIPASRITAVGMGEANPLYSNATRAGRIKNRRIEFKLHRMNQQE